MKHLSRYLCTAFAGISSLISAAPADWPQWRGPNHDDISTETGLLKDWPAGGPALVWESKGLGDGYSSISIFGNRIYTAGDKGAESFVEALNLADGKPVWSAKLGKAGAVGQPPFQGPRATPTTDGEFVFAVSQWGEMVCFRVDTGKEVWRRDYTKDFGGACPFWGYAESPLIDGEKVVVTPGGSQGALVALNKKDGSVIWQSKDFTDAAHYSSMIVVELGGVRQYIQLTPASVAGIAAADGKLLWKAPRKGQTAVIPTPIYDDGFVYVTSGYGVGCNLFKVTPDSGKFSAEQVYANKVMVNHHGGVIKMGDYVYGYSEAKGWTCQDFKTGEAKWQEKEKLGKGSLGYADGHFYLRQEDIRKGTVALIEASPEGYHEHGRFDPPDHSGKNSWPHPLVVGGKLYLRDQDVLLCYDVKAK
jgi:outer membrane protein assembly factor BamB